MLASIAALASHARAFAALDAFDVLDAEQDIPATPTQALVATCEFDALPGRPLLLAEAVERALCGNPKTRAAWADVKAQAAAVGVARAAYLPTLSGDYQGVRDSAVTHIQNQPTLSSDVTSSIQSMSITLGWLLYDFGAREAAQTSANALLATARATQEATLQSVFAMTAKDYYAAQAAIGALAAARDVERMTLQSMVAAQSRVDRGVAPVTDALQAQTQHEEALYSLTKAEGNEQVALGTLAIDMGLNPDAPLELPPVTDGAAPGREFEESVSELIRQVKNSHPAVSAAQAQYEAVLAKVEQTRARGLPSISLVGKYSRNNQPQSLGLGLPTYPASGRDRYIGVQLNIPLFEGFGRYYQTRQAQAQAERQADVLEETRQQVALDVWNSYQALTAAMRNVHNGTSLRDIAQRSWEAARHRYDSGVGNILELMSTQASLANAKQRHVQALADWGSARVDLASKLGWLRAADLRGEGQEVRR
jgi:outer membrane protein